MNLKESFRYQNFLDSMMRSAVSSVVIKEHCLTTTKKHFRSKANPDADDIVENVETENFFKNDNVLEFMKWLVNEKNILTQAINKAKASTGLDLDSAIETNKFRQQVSNAIKSMFRHTPRKFVEEGRDYKFNLEGNQVSYYYDIEVESIEAYDRAKAKNLMRDMIESADGISAEIDAALINTQVGYKPKFNVNESFDDVMEAFIVQAAE